VSIDELPQFLNVLKGEMSVVGPRPHLEEHNEKFSKVFENYYVRSFVKPGITGLAQVQGFRGEAADEYLLKRRIEADIIYLENWSWSGDLIIILKTALQMFLPPRSAY
jgi:lipopolysaccharide/colanic/teichoic acid biosynthesis glycosyltransferase